MEANKEPHPPIIDQLKEYAEIRLKLAKLRASMVLAFIFGSITLAYYLGDVLGATWRGFGCVALLYLIIALIIKFNKKSLERPIINGIIQKIFK
jgi:hypothetical protein